MLKTIKLEINDVMLLFTDGITEAFLHRGSNSNSGFEANMFSYEKLVETFERQGKQSTERIKNEILNELKAYKCNDDVTMVIMKRIN